MSIITQMTTLALAIVLSTSLTLAQQPVRRTAVKATARPQTSAYKAAASQTKKTAITTSNVPKTQATAQEPAVNTAPTVAHQAQTQPVAQLAPAPTRPTVRDNGHRSVYLNAGVGLATYYGGGIPLGISVEAAVKNNFSVGGSIDYFRYNYGAYSGGYTFIYAGARGSYHFNSSTNDFDPYIGASLGFRHAGYSDSYGYSYDGYSNSYNSGLFIGIHVGARYMFSPKLGGFAEVGYGVSALKLGLAAKF